VVKKIPQKERRKEAFCVKLRFAKIKFWMVLLFQTNLEKILLKHKPKVKYK
jgi:hypothetical protein